MRAAIPRTASHLWGAWRGGLPQTRPV